MVLFPNDKVTIYENIKDAVVCGLDQYDDPKKCLVEVETVMGDLQLDNPSSTMEEYGKADQSIFTLFLPVNCQITRTSQIRVDGYDRGFRVIGSPKMFNTLIPHIEAKLIQER